VLISAIIWAFSSLSTGRRLLDTDRRFHRSSNVFEPWFAQMAADLLKISPESRQILILISTMPAAILGPVFAARYNCAAKTASLLTFTHMLSARYGPAVFAFLS
jgi:predicted permease